MARSHKKIPDPYREAFADLRQKLRELDRERYKVQEAIASLEAVAASARSRRKTTRVVNARRLTHTTSQSSHSGNGTKPKNMPEAAAIVLRETGRPMHIAEIAEEMHQRWYPHRTAASIRNTVTGTLDARARKGSGFTKPKSATYGLTTFSTN